MQLQHKQNEQNEQNEQQNQYNNNNKTKIHQQFIGTEHFSTVSMKSMPALFQNCRANDAVLKIYETIL